MSRVGDVEQAPLVAFRERLAEIDVDSVVVSPASVPDELDARIDYPAIASPGFPDELSLPADVDGSPDFEAIEGARTGVTPARLGIASHGSIVVTPTVNMEGPVSLYPPKHVAVVRADDVVSSIGDALEILSTDFENGSNDAIFVTGPSSTGDMGGLVTGVHGPAEMEVVLVR